MKKILTLTLALCMILALCACGGAKEEAPAAEAAPADEVKTLIMGTNAAFPPYEYIGDDGETIVGFEVDILAYIADKLGMKLEIADMEFGSVLTSVQTGKVDIGVSGLTVTEERKQNVNFTISYTTARQSIIVTDDSPITSVDDLFDVGGYTVGVQRNTTGDLYTTWDLEDEGLATIDRYSKAAEAVQALKTGKVDCVVIDDQPAKAFVAEVEGLKILETEYVEEMYAGAMSKDNTEMYEAVNNTLKELIADGTVQSIIDKYISAD